MPPMSASTSSSSRPPSSGHSTSASARTSAFATTPGTTCGEGRTLSQSTNSPADAPPPRPPRLRRRETTKELIGRFEAMGGADEDPEAGGGGGRRGTRARSGTMAVPAPVPGERKDKGRSPIRQSLRNLLAVFKKASRVAPPPPPSRSPTPTLSLSAQVERRTEVVQAGVRTRGARAYEDLSTPPPPPPPPRKDLRLEIPTAREPVPDTVCLTPAEDNAGMKTGPLLYLARLPASSSSATPLPPVWMPCTVTLHRAHLLVVSETTGGHPVPRVIPLGECADVRSLADGEVRPAERAGLPDEGAGSWKALELVFEGNAKTRERFVAGGLAERANWVCAIWWAVFVLVGVDVQMLMSSGCRNAVLKLQSEGCSSLAANDDDLHLRDDDLGKSVKRTSTRSSHRREPAEHESAMSRLTTADMERTRTLPPIPVTPNSSSPRRSCATPVDATPSARPQLGNRLTSFADSVLSTMPAPPLVLTPSPRGSRFSTRPSIQNLDKKSVVRQRLAQIECGGGSASPVSSRPQSPISPLSMAGRRRKGTASGSGREQMERQDTDASREGSFLEAYMGKEEEEEDDDDDDEVLLRSRLLAPFASAMVEIKTLNDPPARLSAASNGAKEPADRVTVLRNVGRNTAASSAPSGSVDIAPAAVDPTVKPMIENIQHGIQVLHDGSATQVDTMNGIRTRVDDVFSELRHLSDSNRANDADILAKMEELQVDVRGQISKLRATVKTAQNASISKDPVVQPSVELPGLAELHEKLENLVQLAEARQSRIDEAGSEEGQNVPSNLEEVLMTLRDAEEQRASQMEQQTDSIRYLNQLNTWLEAFVKHGISQIEGVAGGVQQLCRDLGPVQELQDAPPNDRDDLGDEGEPKLVYESGGLLSDVRKLLVQNMEREQSNVELHASMGGLIAAVQEDMRRNAETRNSLTTESVIGLIDRQRQDQERLLKAVAAELSNDIRGERLRFVEAMKEATAINVQSHVEEFKKELTREVMMMTQEVTRLQRERQGLETQISDLFAFYSKQKQTTPRPNGAQPAALPNAAFQLPLRAYSMIPALPPSPLRRPLPSPALSSVRE
ncbi:uncharacterized protein BXZ73DRAFT_74735 [Epithele typhae]|uniref:uncharacterized protein n=1 Tax=Epithele typhae TaxID=378194 RepID=UPI002007AFC0|nr:uncharacterized protein BXZ73DRAFT_74735 [Epithele typhae]KAH9942484.1 hypothetical protein BXZ73DRAFT_74735 [Epithele typhae]